MKNFMRFITLIFLFYSITAFSSVFYSTKWWSDINVNGHFKNHSRKLFALGAQGRFDLQKPLFDHGFVFGALGYHYLPSLTLWVGYLRNSKNYLTGSSGTRRLWEQGIWHENVSCHFTLFSRTRIEHRYSKDHSGWNHRLRERISFLLQSVLSQRVSPLFYDEVFFNFNNPSWIGSHNCVDQNRFFSGIRVDVSRHTAFETGYLNQYEWRVGENKMNDVFVLSYYLML